MTEGPPKFYRGVCVRRNLGFLGGPSGYEEASEAEAAQGPIVIDGRKGKKGVCMNWPITCPTCGFSSAEPDDFDVIGADERFVFCPQCSREFNSKLNEGIPQC